MTNKKKVLGSALAAALLASCASGGWASPAAGGERAADYYL
jgi:hypothetical protein